MNWEQEQAQFWAWISKPQDLEQNADEIAALLAPHSQISQAEALGIYNNAYHQRLVEVSSALFPVLFHTLGRDLYTRLWIGYMGAYPPRNGPIHRVGARLHTYVSEHPSFAGLPAVADIVQLESLLTLLFDKVDETPYTLAQLQALPQDDWPAMRWQAKQDWAMFYSRFDLEQYWRLMQDYISQGGEPGNTGFAITGIEPTTSPKLPNYLVLRQEQRMQFQIIRPEMAVFLEGVQAQLDFASLCVAMAEAFPEQEIPSLSLRLLLRALELELLCLPKA